jgi:hypothetical protein
MGAHPSPCAGGSRPRAGARQAIRLSNDEASETIIVAQESATEPQTAEISSHASTIKVLRFPLLHLDALTSRAILPLSALLTGG